ncbi:MAG TPA: TIGR00282 family metallophosphoesterase [Armatimonadetes bacterium]|nr:TIGR00282 family metallophosphoesterase [Armatimonadota bacterium]
MVIIHIGDVVGKIGRKALTAMLPKLMEKHNAGIVVVNGENAAGGNGITPPVADSIFAAGADVITTGNHVFAQKQAEELLRRDSRILRPANYPPGVPGEGAGVFPSRTGGFQVGVINLCGRVFMRELDDPFRTADDILTWMRQETRIVLIDFHAEATSEKLALSRHLDGRVSACVGTHTHVQTADEQVLPGGTAHITDVGMTGAKESIIGVEIEPVLRRFRTQMPARFDPPESGTTILCGVVLEIDPETGRAWSIERIHSEQTFG